MAITAYKYLDSIPHADLATSSDDFGNLKNKRRNVEFARKSDLRPSIQWSRS